MAVKIAMAVDNVVHAKEIKNDAAIMMNDGERGEGVDIVPQ